MKRRTGYSRLLPFLSILALIACLLVASPSLDAPAEAAPGNLVVNPSLEEGVGTPTCFSRSGWGTEGTWAFQPGRTGGRSVEVTTKAYVQGDRKLLQTETAQCAPKVTAGGTYDMEIWYKSSTPVTLTMFRHTAQGWSYWGDVKQVPAAAGWTAATAVTPAIPAGTDQIIFGLSLNTNGTLVTDDYSLSPVQVAPAPPAGQLVANGNLSQGNPVPTCFQVAGWGNRTVAQAISADVPANSVAGTRSFQLSVTNYVSGDAKLLTSEAAGCAPAVTGGAQYDIAIDYKSSGTGQHGLSVFSHTANGWQYWTDLKAVPASGVWTTASARTPAIPAGVDRIAFGLSVAGNGTLSTTNYSARQVAVVVPPPAGTPESVGTWTVQGEQLPIRALHNTLLNDGRVLLIAGSGNEEKVFNAGAFRAVVWTPETNAFKEIPVPYDMFCAGHVTLPDGKVLLAGGTQAFPTQDQGPNTFKGSKKSYYFDPADDTFHPTTDMAGAHWYPSLTKLGNGDVWSAGGLDEKAEGTVLTEMFSSKTMSWLPQNQVPQTWSFWGTYPHMFLLDDGKMFYTGAHTFGNGLPGTGASLYDWTTAKIWDVPGLRQKDMRDQAGSVFVGPVQDQKLMIVGGGNTDGNAAAINLVDIIDFKKPSPAYVPGPDLPGPGKAYVNLVNLPDRTVLAANGARYNRAGNVDTAAIYTPGTNTWRSIDADPVGRNYHSTSILLPSGKVAVMGSNPADNSFELRISLYNPPYLYKGVRPTVAPQQARATYGQALQLAVTGDVASASLISPMSATHQTDTNARLVDLPLTGTGGTRSALVPANRNLLPPGPYMLSVLDTKGVPSIAKWVWIS
ncbi:galactose oxidase-like domain-containing protein [Arthrobacter sp. NPDC092385]|uniref:galactose oxidase-like domain-containing protein n=1 Tax=Arthrobacter sp. NPDC092385 TaxID=3363943 RepID=UPI003824E825